MWPTLLILSGLALLLILCVLLRCALDKAWHEGRLAGLAEADHWRPDVQRLPDYHLPAPGQWQELPSGGHLRQEPITQKL